MKTESDTRKDNKGDYGGVAPAGQPQDLRVSPCPSFKGSQTVRSNMGIIRREKSENYSVIYNECFQNPNLSARAKGIFAYLMTLPDDWKIYKKELAKHFREGRDALNTAFDELEDAGYITKVPERVGGGKLGGWDYTVYESTELLKNRNTVNPSDGESATTKYLPELNTNSTNFVADAPESCDQSQNAEGAESGQDSTEMKGAAQRDQIGTILGGLEPRRREMIEEWMAYKKERKQSYKPIGLEKLISKWSKFNDETVQMAIDQAIASNWSGCFPEKIEQNQPRQQIPTF